MQQIAEWYDADFQYELAIEYYKKANDKAEASNNEDFGTQCMLKAADLMVLSKEDRFVDAIKVYLWFNTELKVILRNNYIGV